MYGLGVWDTPQIMETHMEKQIQDAMEAVGVYENMRLAGRRFRHGGFPKLGVPFWGLLS